MFYITGGLLLQKSARVEQPVPGRLEFRSIFDGRFLLTAVHDFRPALPWHIYRVSQARVHLLVMNLFGRHLARYANRKTV